MPDPQPTDAPAAEVVHVHGKRVSVLCPYCGDQHEHTVESLGRPERRAPGCGLTRSTAQRVAGYTFTTSRKD